MRSLEGWGTGPLGKCQLHRHTARKEHECLECHEVIQPGDEYEVARWTDLKNEWTQAKTCLACADKRSEAMHKYGYFIPYGDLSNPKADYKEASVYSGHYEDEAQDV